MKIKEKYFKRLSAKIIRRKVKSGHKKISITDSSNVASTTYNGRGVSLVVFRKISYESGENSVFIYQILTKHGISICNLGLPHYP
jgi:hypothetical protein